MSLSTIPSRGIHSNSTPIFKETNNLKDGLTQNDWILKIDFIYSRAEVIIHTFYLILLKDM